jgi:RHS repeat-associated protein
MREQMKYKNLLIFFAFNFLFIINGHAECTSSNRVDLKLGLENISQNDIALHNQCGSCPTPDGCVGGMAPYFKLDHSPYILYGRYLSCGGQPLSFDYVYSGEINTECVNGNYPKDVAATNLYPVNNCGSIIQTSNQVLGESIPVVGASFKLVYFSNRVIGKRGDYKSTVQLTGATVSSNVSGYTLSVKDELGNILYSNAYDSTANQSYTYEWATADANASSTWASAPRIFLTKEIASDYTLPDTPITKYLGKLRVLKLGLGGWFPSIWHFYDANSKILYKGDGNLRNVTGVADGSYTRIANEDGSQVYYFNSNGKIAYTKTGLTGATIYTFAYDSSGRLSTITQPFGKVTTFNRLSDGTFQSITSPNGAITTATLNSNGYLYQLISPKPETYSMTYYGTGGLLNTFTVPSGDVTTLAYDTDGNLLTDSHSGGVSSTLAKTSTGITNTSAVGRISKNSMDSSGFLETITSPSGFLKYVTNNSDYIQNDSAHLTNTTYFSTDPRFGNQVKRITRIDNNNFGYRSSSFTNSTNLNTSGDPFSINTITNIETIGSSVNTSTYDGSTRTKSFSTYLGKTALLQIDQYERPILTQVGNLTARAYTYTNDLLTGITEGVRANTLAYNTLGLLQSVTNSLSQVTSFTYDAAQRLKTTTLPDSRVITYTYDYNGNLTSITPPLRSNVTPTGTTPHTMTFGLKDTLLTYAPPTLTGVTTVNTTYTYNNDKQMTKITRPDGKIINFNYNATTGLLDTLTGSFGTITKTYTNELPTTVSSIYSDTLTIGYMKSTPTSFSYTKSGTNIYSYSRAPYSSVGGKIGSETISGKGTSSVDQTINYTYDDDEYLSYAGDLQLSYNTPNGQLTGTTLGNITDAYTYNSFGEIASYEAKYNTTSLYKYVLTRDAIGRVSQKDETLNGVLKTFVYTYDSAGRLTQVTTNGSVTATYSYDENSNRSGGTIGGVATTATYDRQDRLTNYNGTALTYNANGEILTKGSATFTFDYFGNIKTYVNGSTSITYEIDPNYRRFGRLVSGSVVNRYIYNPEGQMVGLLDNANKLVKTFVYGSKSHVPDYFIDSSGNKFRIITDYLGSVRLVVSSTGTVMQRMEHDEFGRVVQDTSVGYTPFGFAGGLYDSATGLVQFGARAYDSQLGRWVSKDPILFSGRMTNLYGYTFLDPINYADPSGLAPGDPFPNEREAAGDAINFINPASISQNREYGGYIYKNANGSYVATTPIMGSPAGLSLGRPPAGTTADYHTHGAFDPRYNNEHFSKQDLKGNAAMGINGYLGTPAGAILGNFNGVIEGGLSCPAK